ncbi:unnamed protein product [Closterium sp. NIES-65]|nr:unnamed protein product [Closterium sp. NIES-65]
MAKDRCLAGRAPGSVAKHLEGGAGSVRAGIVASLCTALGGPVATMEECRLRDETGQQMAAVGEMYSYLHRTHVRGGRVISAQHMRRFVQTVVVALRSVTGLDEASCARVTTLLHGFDDAIVTSDAVGCSQGGAWLQWRVGVKHNTTIHVGDKVTWVWDDDLPHSLRVAGMGEVQDPLFLGFGGHRLAVSRQLACTPMNVGAGDVADYPLPCVLMRSGVGMSNSRNVLTVLPATAGDGAAGERSFESSEIYATLEQVICLRTLSHQPPVPARAVLAVLLQDSVGNAGQAKATEATVTTGTMLFPTFNPTPDPTSSPTPPTTTSTSSSSASSSTSSSASPVYFCAPGCRLQRLANGVCDAACNTRACTFDGGDCACVDPIFGPGICPCPPAHTRRDDGSCCLSTAVGTNLNFPFSLQRYGPNYTETNHAFAAERDTAVDRFVSHRNRLLIGMVLQQDRWGTEVCTGQGVMHLGGWCSSGPSRQPFGVNPHFLPTSPIYDSAASANMSQLDNSTFGSKLLFNPQGLPYGFIYPVSGSSTMELANGGTAGKGRGTAGKACGTAGKVCGTAGKACATAGKACGTAGKARGTAGKACATAGKACGSAGKACGAAGKACGAAGKACGTAGKACGAAGKATRFRASPPSLSVFDINLDNEGATGCLLSQLKNTRPALCDALPRFPLVFDINLDNEGATRRLHYLVEGGYIDNSTRSIDVTFITFNGEARTFVLTTVTCSVNTGGQIGVTIRSQPALMHMYGSDSSPVNTARLVLEIFYVLGLLWNVYGEAREMMDHVRMEGTVLGYFGLVWNWVDLLSLALQFTTIAIWMVLWRAVEAFDMQPRYNIYYSLLEMPRYWAVPNPPTGFMLAGQAFLDLRYIINLRAVYFALQGIKRLKERPLGSFLLVGHAFLDLRYIINLCAVPCTLPCKASSEARACCALALFLFLMMVRLLKFMDFQPYLGVITRSLALATPSLLHFFLLSFAVFFCFSMYAYLVFGGALEQVRGCDEEQVCRGVLFLCLLILGFVLASRFSPTFICFISSHPHTTAPLNPPFPPPFPPPLPSSPFVFPLPSSPSLLPFPPPPSPHQFSTVLTSMFSCFLLLLNDNSSAYFFQRLESWDLIAAMLFFLMFIVLMVFILLNFLIAIIVDAFMSVKDSNVVATSITSDLVHICKYKWNCWCGRYMPYSRLLQHLVNLGAKDTRVDEADRRMRRYKSIQRRVGSVFSSRIGSGNRASSSYFTRAGDSQPAFPVAAVPRVRKQHVLKVKDKRIDEISLSIILQRRLDRQRSRGHQSATVKPSDTLCSAVTCSSVGAGAHDTGMDELSQALVLQCGEVVKQSALPVKKPVQKLSLAHIQEEVVRSQQAVEEVRGMVMELQSEVRGMMASVRSDMRSIMALLVSNHTAAAAAAAAPAGGGGPPPPSPPSPPPPLPPAAVAAVSAAAAAAVPAASATGVSVSMNRLSGESRVEGGDATLGDAASMGNLQQAVGSSGSTRISGSLSGKRGSDRRVSFLDDTIDDDESPSNRTGPQQQSLIDKA